ncbi:MAG: efflux RND transporter periplasmic adaptor subunit, partial [Granulosicoccus sp.]|nr:efflux RND transporter periplasmic adaptor subunit [Granulosicoccus sp.]
MSSEDASVQSIEYTVSAGVSGRIASMNVATGQFVKKGDLLFSLENKSLESSVDEALLNLIEIRTQIRSMQDTDSSADSQLNKLDERYQQAKARYRQAVFDVQKLAVISTVEGYVGKVRYDVDNTIAAGESVLTLIDSHRLWIKAVYPARRVKEIQPGQRADIDVVDYPDVSLSARVSSIETHDTDSPTKLAEDSVTVRLVPEFLPRDSVLQPGMPVVARIDTQAPLLLSPVDTGIVIEPVVPKGEGSDKDTRSQHLDIPTELPTETEREHRDSDKDSLTEAEMDLQRVLVAKATENATAEVPAPAEKATVEPANVDSPDTDAVNGNDIGSSNETGGGLSGDSERQISGNSEVTASADSEIAVISDAEAAENSDSEITQNSVTEVTVNNVTVVTENNGSEVTENNGSEVTEVNGSEVTEVNGSEVTEVNGSEVTENNGSEVTENN